MLRRCKYFFQGQKITDLEQEKGKKKKDKLGNCARKSQRENGRWGWEKVQERVRNLYTGERQGKPGAISGKGQEGE